MSTTARPTDVLHLAELARLSLSAEEVSQFEKKFQDILGFIAEIDKVSASPHPLTTTVSGVSHRLRDDVARPSTLADNLIALAPERRDRHVRVPAVL